MTSLLKVVDEASEEAKTACGGLEEGSSAATAAAADALLSNSSGSGSGSGSSSSSAYGAVKQLLGLCEGSPDYVTGLGTETATIQSVLRLLRWTACGDAQAPPALHTIAATCLGILVWARTVMLTCSSLTWPTSMQIALSSVKVNRFAMINKHMGELQALARDLPSLALSPAKTKQPVATLLHLQVMALVCTAMPVYHHHHQKLASACS